MRVPAPELPSLSTDERRELIDHIVSFLRDDLAAHAASKERSLSPYVARLLGDPRGRRDDGLQPHVDPSADGLASTNAGSFARPILPSSPRLLVYSRKVANVDLS